MDEEPDDVPEEAVTDGPEKEHDDSEAREAGRPGDGTGYDDGGDVPEDAEDAPTRGTGDAADRGPEGPGALPADADAAQAGPDGAPDGAAEDGDGRDGGPVDEAILDSLNALRTEKATYARLVVGQLRAVTTMLGGTDTPGDDDGDDRSDTGSAGKDDGQAGPADATGAADAADAADGANGADDGDTMAAIASALDSLRYEEAGYAASVVRVLKDLRAALARHDDTPASGEAASDDVPMRADTELAALDRPFAASDGTDIPEGDNDGQEE